jgi:hypothetical protein
VLSEVTEGKEVQLKFVLSLERENFYMKGQHLTHSTKRSFFVASSLRVSAVAV